MCGAPNARLGIRVPLALVGAELPPGSDGKLLKIGLGKLRGVDSEGMLCSARELKLSEDHGGLLELSADAPLGADIRTVLSLDDHLFTLKLTPNLAHCLSVYGIAREVSALTGSPLKTTAFPPAKVSNDAKLPVRIEAADLCGRFSGRVVRGVNPRAATPLVKGRSTKDFSPHSGKKLPRKGAPVLSGSLAPCLDVNSPEAGNGW